MSILLESCLFEHATSICHSLLMPAAKRKYVSDCKRLGVFLRVEEKAKRKQLQSFFERSPFLPIASHRPTAYGEFPQTDVANTYIQEFK